MAPNLYRLLTGQLQLSLPYQPGNRAWLRDRLGERVHLTWVKAGYWAMAREHLMPLLEALVAEYGKVAVRLEFRQTQKCDRRCRDAQGDDCVCSCLGTNHKGASGRNWFEVGESTLIKQLNRGLLVFADGYCHRAPGGLAFLLGGKAHSGSRTIRFELAPSPRH
jgi:hypothetical protein